MKPANLDLRPDKTIGLGKFLQFKFGVSSNWISHLKLLLLAGAILVGGRPVFAQDSAGAQNSTGAQETIRRDEVQMHSGQSIFGSVEERKTEDGVELIVQLEDGTTLLLDRKAYLRWSKEPEAMDEYRKRKASSKWTLEDQIKLAQWCGENRLKELADMHYRIVVDIDPDNAEARKKLGYIQRDGEWTNFDEIKQRLGYQKQGSRWELPEVKELREGIAAYKETQQMWKTKLRILNKKAISRGRDQDAAVNEILSIRDPAAVEILLERLEESRSLPEQALYVEALCNIESYASSKALVKFYLLNQNDPESRDRAFEAVLSRKDYQKTAMFDFVAALDPNFELDGEKVTDPDLNTQRMGRAALGLEKIGVPFGIESLIRSLRVEYKKESNVAPTSAFGSNGSVASNPGGGTVVQRTQRDCPEALDTLKKFTGLDPGFGYDQMAWAQWWVKENTPVNLDLRRDK